MSQRLRIIATNPLHPDAEDLLRQSHDYEAVQDNNPATLKRLISDANGIIVRTKLPDDIFSGAPALLACVRHGVGLDFIPVEAATTLGIPVANLLEANKQAVVEHVVTAALLLSRNYHQLESRFRKEGWSARNGYSGFELMGKTLGIVGCGRIGRGVAQAMQAAFGMKVLGYDISSTQEDHGIERVTLDDLFSRADVVTLHLPSTPQTTGIINAGLLARMRPGAVLINAARGDLIREDDLMAGLARKSPAAAAIDVFESEPLAPGHRFFAVENLFLTPHVAGGTAEAALRMSMQSVEAMLHILSGQKPDSLVNPSVWEGHLKRLEMLS